MLLLLDKEKNFKFRIRQNMPFRDHKTKKFAPSPHPPPGVEGNTALPSALCPPQPLTRVDAIGYTQQTYCVADIASTTGVDT